MIALQMFHAENMIPRTITIALVFVGLIQSQQNSNGKEDKKYIDVAFVSFQHIFFCSSE
jgi:hypothetical protein